MSACCLPPRSRETLGRRRLSFTGQYLTVTLAAERGEPNHGNAHCRGEPPNTIGRLATQLSSSHGAHYMIWNFSEVTYDYSAFNDQVMEFRFPGHPAPPLELLVRICNAVANWLAADDKNVAVVHCRTGKRRTCTVLACLMAWLGQSPDPMQAIKHVAHRRNIPIVALSIPSQRRYIRYFDRVLKGELPNGTPLTLQRIIVNTVPNIRGNEGGRENMAPRSSGEPGNEEELTGGGCRAELQLLQNGKLLWDSSWAIKAGAAATDDASSPSPSHTLFLPRDGCMSFVVGISVTADLVLRCSHVTCGAPHPETGIRAQKRVPVFRTAFNVGKLSGEVGLTSLHPVQTLLRLLCLLLARFLSRRLLRFAG